MTTNATNDRQRPLSPGKAYFNEKELAERLGMSVKWVQARRLKGDGVRITYMGRSVRYSAEDILEFEERSRRDSTSDPGWTSG